MAELRFLRLGMSNKPTPPYPPHPPTFLIPWLPFSHTQRPKSMFQFMPPLPTIPLLPLVVIDPENDHALIIRMFQPDHHIYITGWITLPEKVQLANVVDAQNLFRELETMILQSKSVFAKTDILHTRPKESHEKYDMMVLNLKCPENSLNINISCNIHPDKKYKDIFIYYSRIQDIIDTMTSHLGHFLVHGNWNSQCAKQFLGASNDSSDSDSDTSMTSSSSDFDYFYDEIILQSGRFPKQNAQTFLHRHSVDFYFNVIHGLSCKLTEFL